MRSASIKDLKEIVNIINSAKESLNNDGIDQWQIDSMNEDFLKGQILSGDAVVFEEDGRLLAYCLLSKEQEEAYKIWDDDFTGKLYLTIHTFAVGKNYKGRGIASKFMEQIKTYAHKQGLDSLRIDTHRDNYKMRGLIEKLGFREIGEIFIDEETTKKPRICYELIL